MKTLWTFPRKNLVFPTSREDTAAVDLLNYFVFPFLWEDLFLLDYFPLLVLWLFLRLSERLAGPRFRGSSISPLPSPHPPRGRCHYDAQAVSPVIRPLSYALRLRLWAPIFESQEQIFLASSPPSRPASAVPVPVAHLFTLCERELAKSSLALDLSFFFFMASLG